MTDTNKKKVKRGDIYYFDFGENKGSVQSGARPVVVVQCEKGNEAGPTTVIAAVTTVLKKRYMPTHIILGKRFGLKKNSMVILEQLKTVNQSDLERFVGRIDDPEILKQIGFGIKKEFGLWVYKPREDRRCLCSRCLKDYMNHPDYLVRRANPFSRYKERCEKCDGYGYDYIITEQPSKRGGRDG